MTIMGSGYLLQALSMVCFLAAFVLHWSFIKRKRYLSRIVSYPLMAMAFILLSLFLAQRGMRIGACPIGNPYEIVTFIVWSSLLLYLLLGLTFRINYLGFFTAGFSLLFLFVINWIPSLDYKYNLSEAAHNQVIVFHAALAFFSYGVLLMAALLAVMYLVQYHGLTKRRSGSFFSFLPPLIRLDQLQLAFLSAGLFIMTVALMIGSLAYFGNLESVPHFKLIAALMIWLLYAVVFVLRLLNRLYASSFAWFLIGAFVLAILALVPVDQARKAGMQDRPLVERHE